MVKKRQTLLIVAFFLTISFVTAFAPTTQPKDNNNPLKEFQNNFPMVDEGIPKPNKALEKIPYTQVSSVLWDEEGYPAKISFRDDKVVISDKNSLIRVAQEFLDSYSDVLGLDEVDLQIRDVDFPASFSASVSASPTPTPTQTSTPVPSKTYIYPSEKIATVVYEQVITNPQDNKKYPIASAFLVLAFTKGTDNIWRQVSYKANLIRDTEIIQRNVPFLNKEEAVQRARDSLISVNPEYAFLESKKIELIGYPANDGEVAIWAYKIYYEKLKVNGKIEKPIVTIDAAIGGVLRLDDSLEWEQISGRVSGSIFPGTSAKEQKDDVGFKDNYVWISNSQDLSTFQITTNENGMYQGEIDSSKLDWFYLSSQPIGPWALVSDYQTGQSASMMRHVSEGYNINWKEYDDSYKQEQSNVFYHTNIVHDFAVQPHINAEMNFQIPIYVNIDESCNAYYDKENPSLNFLEMGRYVGINFEMECEATSLFSDVIYHEYGHGITHSFITLDEEAFPYEGETGNLNEGLSDYLACTLSDSLGNEDPACMNDIELGRGGTCFRRCDSDDKFPEDYNSEPHSGMQIISGALWDMRESIIQTSNEKGIMKKDAIKIADSLAYGALKLQPTSFMDYLESIIISDDDNGNLDDGSPHIESICESFLVHGIESSYCAGFTNMPMSLILFPRNEYIFNTDKINIIGTVWPSKDASVEEWILEFGKPVAISGPPQPLFEIKWSEIKRSSNAIKMGALLEDFDISNLDPNNAYYLRLKIKDSFGKENENIILFSKSLITSIKISYEKKYEQNIQNPLYLFRGGILVVRSGDGKYDTIGGTFICDPGQLSCNLKARLYFKNPDLVDLIVLSIDMGELNQVGIYEDETFYFYKHSVSGDEISIATKDASPIHSNIDNVLNDLNMKLKSTKIALYPRIRGNTDLFFVDRYSVLNPERLSFFADDNLVYKDYIVNLVYHAENLDEKKFASLNTENIYYPFDKDFFVDQSQIKNIDITIHDALKDVHYELTVSNQLKKGENSLDSGVADSKYNLGPGIYRFFYIPKLLDTKILHIIYANAFSNSNKRIRSFITRIFYNGRGSDPFNSPDELSESIEVYKNPYLEIILPDLKTDRRIRGRLKDKFEGGVTFPSISGKITLSYPTKDSIEIKIIEKKGDWNWDIPCFDITCPLEGEYRISWVLDDVFKDRKLESYNRYYFDGKKFNAPFLRGDSNIDGKVDLSDAVHTLNLLFKGQGELSCEDATDANDDSVIDVSDSVFTLLFLFRGDVTIPGPYPKEGWDLTDDLLGCAKSPPLSLNLESDLIAHYSFDNADIKDSSGNGNDGFISLGKGSFVERKQGRALSLDGVDDFAFIPPSASLDGMEELTISAWVKMEDLSRRQVILTKGLIDDYNYVLDIDNNLFNGKVGSVNGNVEAKMPLSEIGDEAFHHVALVYTGNSLSLYVDGVRKDVVEHPLDGAIKTTSFPLVFGARGQKGSQETFDHFKGILDEIRIYNRVLNDREIKMLGSAA